jgi:hypothetical protein
MAAYGASDALIGRRPQRGLWALLAIMVPVFLGLTCELFHYEDYEIFVGLLVVGELVAFFLWPAIAPEEFLNGESRGRLKADREGLWFNKKLLVPRHRIDSGFIEGHVSGRLRVHLSTKRTRHQVWIEVDDDKAAESLLSALDLRQDRRALSFEVESAPLRTPLMQKAVKALTFIGGAMLVGAVMYYAHINALFGFTLVPVLVVYTLVLKKLRRMTKIAVGADGLGVRAGGKWREIPHREVKKVARHDADVLATTEKDGVLKLRFYGAGAFDRSDALATALREGMNRAAHDAGDVFGGCGQGASSSLHSATSSLACAGRSREEWLKDLKRVTGTAPAEAGGQGGGYRGSAIPDEDLWAVLEQSSADREVRAGALAALQPRLTEESRIRIAEIAAATVQKDLRAALDAASNGESDDKILAAFESGSSSIKR